MTVGTRVKIRAVTVAEARALQEEHGGLTTEMESMLGKQGVVTSVISNVDFRVTVDGGGNRSWNAELIEVVNTTQGDLVNSISPGSRVRIRSVLTSEAEAAQSGHGNCHSSSIFLFN